MLTNLTEFENFTYPFNEVPLHFQGMINGTSPIVGDFVGNVSAIVRVQGLDILIQTSTLQSVEMTVITICVILITIKLYFGRR